MVDHVQQFSIAGRIPAVTNWCAKVNGIHLQLSQAPRSMCLTHARQGSAAIVDHRKQWRRKVEKFVDDPRVRPDQVRDQRGHVAGVAVPPKLHSFFIRQTLQQLVEQFDSGFAASRMRVLAGPDKSPRWSWQVEQSHEIRRVISRIARQQIGQLLAKLLEHLSLIHISEPTRPY